MDVMMLIIYLLTVWGMVNIISNEVIFSKPRVFIKKYSKFLGKLVSCSTCFSFWVGLILFFIFNPFDLCLLDPFFGGLISSGVVNIIEMIKIKFGVYE